MKVLHLDGLREIDFWSITIRQNGGDSLPDSSFPEKYQRGYLITESITTSNSVLYLNSM